MDKLRSAGYSLSFLTLEEDHRLLELLSEARGKRMTKLPGAQLAQWRLTTLLCVEGAH